MLYYLQSQPFFAINVWQVCSASTGCHCVMLNSNTATTRILLLEVRHCGDKSLAIVVVQPEAQIASIVVQADAKQPPSLRQPHSHPL